MILRVDQNSPQVRVTMKWGAQEPAGEILLYVKRTGDAAEFAAYPPLDVQGGVLTFQFDDLLWTQKQGRFTGRLAVGDVTKATLDIEWKDSTVIVAAENPNV